MTLRQDAQQRKPWINSLVNSGAEVQKYQLFKQAARAKCNARLCRCRWYSHVCHDFVQEDAVHQLHEHVDALLGADGVARTQRAQGPHLQGGGGERVQCTWHELPPEIFTVRLDERANTYALTQLKLKITVVYLETPAALVQNPAHEFAGVQSAGKIPLLFSRRMPHAQRSHSGTAGRRSVQARRREPLERAGIKSRSSDSFISSTHERPQSGQEWSGVGWGGAWPGLCFRHWRKTLTAGLTGCEVVGGTGRKMAL